MNPLIQLNRQLQYLFIALLLAGFAIPAMGEKIKPLTTGNFSLILSLGKSPPRAAVRW